MSAWPPWKPSGKLSAEAPRHLYHITWVINTLSKLYRIPLGLSNAPVCSEEPSRYGSEFQLQYVWVCVEVCVSLRVCVCVPEHQWDTLTGWDSKSPPPYGNRLGPPLETSPPPDPTPTPHISLRGTACWQSSPGHGRSTYTGAGASGNRTPLQSAPFLKSLLPFLSTALCFTSYLVYITCNCFLTRQAAEIRWDLKEGMRKLMSTLRCCVSLIWGRENETGSGR